MNINFSAAYTRIREITGCRTQIEIATCLGIRQSSISDAKKRGALPDSWLITLLNQKGINPTWIMTGEGARYLAPTETAPDELNLKARLLSPELEQRIRTALTDIVLVETLTTAVRKMTGDVQPEETSIEICWRNA